MEDEKFRDVIGNAVIEEEKKEGEADPPSNEVYVWGDDSRG